MVYQSKFLQVVSVISFKKLSRHCRLLLDFLKNIMCYVFVPCSINFLGQNFFDYFTLGD